ncbi:ABC transporter ATP-binding protein [Solicola gregarius]|uniref:ABC transporter ATP-binding protein/permease n=1 Tax=Solicola gregarius TaxID=2908642 RepID=A0AA46TKU2_9ACTN|nr:ABC transporter ATP-binding protein [Solicola gregarius]UYM07141.1 ABC transporter ATP-binding protein/permease [Solicola gregarius]
MSDPQSAQPRAEEHDPDSRWRGVAAEDVDEVAATQSLVLRDRSRRLLGSLLRPHRRTLVAILGVVLVENAARLAIPYLVKVGIDDGIPPMKAGDGATILTWIIGLVLAIVLVQAVARQAFLIMAGRVGQQTLLELRRRLFRHFQRLTPAFHDRYTSGRVISRSTSDIDAIEEMLDTGFDGLVTAMLTLFGTAILLLVLDLELGLIALLSFPFLLWLTAWFRKQSAVTYRRTRVTIAALIVHFVESMTGIRAVQAFRREGRNEELFAEVNDDNRVANENAFRLVGLFMPGIKLIGNVTIAAVLFIGAYRVFDGDVTIGVLTAFLIYLRQFFEPMQEISQFYNTFQSASAALEKLSGVLEEEPEVVEPTRPVSLDTAHGDVLLRDVEFEYQPGRPVLPGLGLEIPAGQTLALVGTTGAGKTTIAKLVARFYDPTAGAVLLDGVNLRDIADDDLRRDVVMVTQENFMFAGSIADNIRLGKPTATDAEVRRAADSIGASTFIEAMPSGYDTQVESRGGRLSAGQKQLIAFARAFLADPAVLILDEATSSLDVPSERLVQRALRTILADRTSVIIAHRLTTVEVADRVVVLEHGRIVEDGTPSDLVAAGSGRYADLHDAWIASLA